MNTPDDLLPDAVNALAQETPGETLRLGRLVFAENVVLRATRQLVGRSPSDVPHLDAALDLLAMCCHASLIVRQDGETPLLTFSLDPCDTQSVVFAAMHEMAQHLRASQQDNASSRHDANHVPVQVVDCLPLPYLTTEETLAALFCCGSYQTSKGPVLVRWNNTCYREQCPFCDEEFKPSWGFWAFLFGLTGPSLCLDCWRKGRDINAFLMSAPASWMEKAMGHAHLLEPDDTEGFSGFCHCGAYWTLLDGRWCPLDDGTWVPDNARSTGSESEGSDVR